VAANSEATAERPASHGGKSTGPRTPEGLARIRAAQTTHGLRTAEMEQMRKLVRELRVGTKRLVELV
jgi:hypothetical protein